MNRVSKDSEYTPWKKSPPKKWNKLFKVTALSLALLIAGAGIIVMFLDMDTLRQSLAKSLSEKTGTRENFSRGPVNLGASATESV